MATVLDSVKRYQQYIEKNYPDDDQKVEKVLKCLDKLFQLGVTTLHLQETGVGRTVNALRKVPGEVGQAARALVCKWKTMVAAEVSDTEEDINDVKQHHNGHGSGKESDDSAHQSRTNNEKSHSTSYEHANGNYSGTKRKYTSSEEDENAKRVKHSSSSENEDTYIHRHNIKIKKESENESEDSYTDDDDSETNSSDYSDKDIKPSHKIKKEPKDDKHSKHSSSKTHYKKEPDSKKTSNSSKPEDKYESSREKRKSSSIEISNSHDSSKEKENSAKKHKTDHKNRDREKKHSDESTSTKHSGSDKIKSRSHKDDHSQEKSKSHSEKHKSEKHSSSTKSEKHSSSSHKSEKEKFKSSEKEITSEKHKSKEKHTSSKEKSKDKSSSSKEKSNDSHKSEKKHSSSEKNKSKDNSDSKSKTENTQEKDNQKKSKHKSSSSSHKLSKSSSESKEDIPKKKQASDADEGDDGIDCGSGASFAEALGMISPVKPKKKTVPLRNASSPSSPFSSDMSPANLLAPTAKLAPLPALEISALPEISPNYKPRPPPKLLNHFISEEDAINAGISSKNQRTKVYSGNKVIGKVPSLYEMCVTVLQDNIDALEYTGGVPYDILKPVVDRATPEQLSNLEHYNPYLMEETDHLWQKCCERKFRNKQRQELETWREMYIRCTEEEECRLKSLTANIRIAQEAKRAPIKQTKMAYVDSAVKPPRNVARKQALHGTAHAHAASPAARVSSLAAAPHVSRVRGALAPAAPPASFKPKKAPLMQKALQFMRGRKR